MVSPKINCPGVAPSHTGSPGCAVEVSRPSISPSVTTVPIAPSNTVSSIIPNVLEDVDSVVLEERDALSCPEAPTAPAAYTA